jgi:hypothetical protein
MKRFPSVGFIYLIVVLLSCCIFFGWATNRGWYEKVRRPRQLKKWAVYLENIAQDFPRDKKRAALLKEAADRWLDLNQPEKALIDLKKALAIDSEDDSSTAKLIRIYYDLDRKGEAVRLARERIDQGHRDWDTISVLLEDLSERGTSDLQSFVEEVLRMEDIPGKRVLAGSTITAVGLTPDSWTVDGQPGYLLIQGLPDKPLVQALWLVCYADRRTLPLTATIDGGVSKRTHTFNKPGRARIQLPEIPAGGRGLFIVKTDKSWVPKGGKDSRRLGVRILVSDDDGETT